MGILDGLNQAQRKAADASDGPVMVIAGPGTGKTKTLTARISYLLAAGKARPEEILALTFTKKAAEEMQARVAAEMDVATPRITTFHGLCRELLGGEMNFVGDAERMRIIKALQRPAELKQLSVKELGLAISRAKNTLAAPEPSLAGIVQAYNDALRAKNLCDFDDLLLDAYKQLQQDGQAKSYRYIFVDEFQDTNQLQYEILRLLRQNDNIFVIGDPNQSIYGFRGASGDIFEQFAKDFPAAQKITLHVNYRSRPAIVTLSNAIMSHSVPLTANTKESGRVRAVQVLNEYGEAQWVLGEIQRAIGGGDFLRAVSDDERSAHRNLRDFAVLYRSRSAAHALQRAIDESGLPFQIIGEGSPYEKPQVQAIIALLRAIANGENAEPDGFSAEQGRKARELLQQYAGDVPGAFAERAIKTLGLEPDRDIAQLIATLFRFKTILQAVNYFDEIAQNGFYDPQAEAITLLTIHASKGLEFPCVFLIGAQEGALPSERGDKQEERRLFYVAATRAQERLEILYSKNRGGQPAVMSSFLAELPSDAFEHTTDPDMQSQARRIAKRQVKRSQQSLF